MSCKLVSRLCVVMVCAWWACTKRSRREMISKSGTDRLFTSRPSNLARTCLKSRSCRGKRLMRVRQSNCTHSLPSYDCDSLTCFSLALVSCNVSLTEFNSTISWLIPLLVFACSSLASDSVMWRSRFIPCSWRDVRSLLFASLLTSRSKSSSFRLCSTFSRCKNPQ